MYLLYIIIYDHIKIKIIAMNFFMSWGPAFLNISRKKNNFIMVSSRKYYGSVYHNYSVIILYLNLLYKYLHLGTMLNISNYERYGQFN